MAVAAIVVAGGSGQRFGRPKQFDLLQGRRILDWSVATAAAIADELIVVVPADVVEEESARLPDWGLPCPARVVAGGRTRASSVRAGLALVSPDAEVVVVHDAARPLASGALFKSVVTAVEGSATSDGQPVAGGEVVGWRRADGAVPGLPVGDTLKRVDRSGRVLSTVDRQDLVAVQTPQAFRADALRRAHTGEPDATDDAGLVEATGGRVVVVPGEAWNLKVTNPGDLIVLEAWIAEGR